MMNLERFIAALGPGEVVSGGASEPAAVEISDLAYDTRAVRPGALFFCVRGRTADGHAFAPTAATLGASALVVDHPLGVALPQLVVADVRAAMPAAATLFFGEPSRELEVAAVTGTNGKTTTAFLLRAILEAAGRRTGLLTNIERRVGGEQRPTGLNTPEAIDLQRLFREMVDRGRPGAASSRRPRRPARQGRLGGHDSSRCSSSPT